MSVEKKYYNSVASTWAQRPNLIRGLINKLKEPGDSRTFVHNPSLISADEEWLC